MDAKTLRRKLAESDVLIAQFAELAGVSANTLSQVLHEHRPISDEMAARLAAGLAQLEADPPARIKVLRGGGWSKKVAS